MDEKINNNDMPREDTPNTLGEDPSSVKSFGPLVGIIIIIVVLLVGGLYFFNTKVDELQGNDLLPTIQSDEETDTIVNQLQSQGTSDEIGAIEEDVNSTDLESLDTELDQLLNEL
ncbi:hypothetical protein HYW58_01315 [Candidatus Kaiserbacteria bacterium]|nr:hypothetical protein [Candidatus Kaiserbacteria bacterium]